MRPTATVCPAGNAQATRSRPDPAPAGTLSRRGGHPVAERLGIRRLGSGPAEQPLQRLRDLFGQPRRLAPGRGRVERLLRRHHEPALAALHLTEPADQAHAAAPAARVEFGGPVGAGLAVGTDQYLPVVADPPLPWAVPADGVHLPRTTAIAGHLDPLPPPERSGDYSSAASAFW